MRDAPCEADQESTVRLVSHVVRLVTPAIRLVSPAVWIVLPIAQSRAFPASRYGKARADRLTGLSALRLVPPVLRLVPPILRLVSNAVRLVSTAIHEWKVAMSDALNRAFSDKSGMFKIAYVSISRSTSFACYECKVKHPRQTARTQYWEKTYNLNSEPNIMIFLDRVTLSVRARTIGMEMSLKEENRKYTLYKTEQPSNNFCSTCILYILSFYRAC